MKTEGKGNVTAGFLRDGIGWQKVFIEELWLAEGLNGTALALQEI